MQLLIHIFSLCTTRNPVLPLNKNTAARDQNQYKRHIKKSKAQVNFFFKKIIFERQNFPYPPQMVLDIKKIVHKKHSCLFVCFFTFLYFYFLYFVKKLKILLNFFIQLFFSPYRIQYYHNFCHTLCTQQNFKMALLRNFLRLCIPNSTFEKNENNVTCNSVLKPEFLPTLKLVTQNHTNH